MGIRFCPPDCPDRHPGCHSVCKDYEENKQKHEKIKKTKNKQRDIDVYCASSIVKNKNKTVKRKQSQRCHYYSNE